MTSLTYRKILITSLGAYFWLKDLSAKFFLGGGLYSGGLYMDEYLRFENIIFVQVIVMFLDFLLTTCLYYRYFFTFVYLFVITVLQKTIGYQIQCSVFGISHFPSKSNVMLELSYSKYNPRDLFSGGLIHGRSFPFQKLVPKCLGAYTRWSLYTIENFTCPPPPPPLCHTL